MDTTNLPPEALEALEELQANAAWHTPPPLTDDMPPITEAQRALVHAYQATDTVPSPSSTFSEIMDNYMKSVAAGMTLAKSWILDETSPHYISLILEEMQLPAKQKLMFMTSLHGIVETLVQSTAPIAIHFGIELPSTIKVGNPDDEAGAEEELDDTPEEQDADTDAPALEGELV
jgi:hypothetical protein